MKEFFKIKQKNPASPFWAFAIHKGHELRQKVKDKIKLTEKQRLREEDPFTDEFANISANRVIVYRSRFEVDLNRKRKRAVYRNPEDAWGLEIWKNKPEKNIINRALELYDNFYDEICELLEKVHKRHGYSVIYDLHSFNYRRDQYDVNKNFPDIIVGTGKIDRTRWLPAIKRIIKIMKEFDFPGKELHVVENSIFPGGNFPYQIANKFPQKCCILSLEFKKFFMNEKTGEPFTEHINHIKSLLKATIMPVQEAVRKIVLNQL